MRMRRLSAAWPAGRPGGLVTSVHPSLDTLITWSSTCIAKLVGEVTFITIVPTMMRHCPMGAFLCARATRLESRALEMKF